MKERTLKEVAQAGLVLGFEWIAKIGNGQVCLYAGGGDYYYRYDGGWWDGFRTFSNVDLQILDYPHDPEKSLLKLSEIVEVEA